jgi:hypothetical protein
MKNRYRVATYHPRDVEDNTKAPNKTAATEDRLQAGVALDKILRSTAIETICRELSADRQMTAGASANVYGAISHDL